MLLPTYTRSYDAEKEDDCRLALYTKMFNLYPTHRQHMLEVTLLGYIDETAHVPLWSLDLSLRRIVQETHRVFRPTVGEILEMACLEIQRVHGVSVGKEDKMRPRPQFPMDAERVAHWLGRGWEAIGIKPDDAPKLGDYLTPELLEIVDRLNDGKRGTLELTDEKGRV